MLLSSITAIVPVCDDSARWLKKACLKKASLFLHVTINLIRDIFFNDSARDK
jgi:hypothetical protein